MLSLTEPDEAASGDRPALAARPAQDENDSKEIILRFDAGPLPPTIRDAYDEIVSIVPGLDQRRAAHRRVVAGLKQRRLPHHAALPLAVRLGFDSLLFMSTTNGQLRRVEHLIFTAGTETRTGRGADNVALMAEQCGLSDEGDDLDH